MFFLNFGKPQTKQFYFLKLKSIEIKYKYQNKLNTNN